MNECNEVSQKLVHANPWLPQPWLIEDSWSENSETVSIKIKPRDLNSVPKASPGQFNMLYSFGIGEIPISFSTIGRDYWEHTIRNVGKVSASLCRLSNGSTIGLRGPYGASWPLKKAKEKDVYIIAGGLGLAPVRPLIEQILDDKKAYGKITVIYGTRDPSQLLFVKDYERWNKQVKFLQTVDCGDSSWKHHVGYIPALIEKLKFNPAESIAYLCGPEIMMRLCSESLLQKNLHASVPRRNRLRQPMAL